MSLASSRRSWLNSFDLNGVIEDYLDWLKGVFYVLVFRFNYDFGGYEYGAFRSPKRGDYLYSERVLRRFDMLRDRLSDDLFFHVKGHVNIVKGQVLHIVLEYDSNRFSIVDSWDRCGVDLNRFMTHLRRHFGRCSIIRCWEAHESAMCHCHMVVVFHEFFFQGRRIRGNYRVFGDDWVRIKSGWDWGYSDVKMVDSVKGGAYYLRKYLSKSVHVESAGSKGLKGLAMCWFMRKRSFSISGELREVYHDAILPNTNSTGEDENGIVKVLVGKDLFGQNVYSMTTKWKFFGFLNSDHVIWDYDFSFVDIDKIEPVDDSERFYRLVEDEIGDNEGYLPLF